MPGTNTFIFPTESHASIFYISLHTSLFIYFCDNKKEFFYQLFKSVAALHWFYNLIYRVTHGNLTSIEWIVLRTAPKKNKLCQCVVSTRWCHSAHCKRVNDHCSKHVSRTPHFPFRRRAVAPSLSRSFNV